MIKMDPKALAVVTVCMPLDIALFRTGAADGKTEEEAAADHLWWLVQHVRLLQHRERLRIWLQLNHG